MCHNTFKFTANERQINFNRFENKTHAVVSFNIFVLSAQCPETSSVDMIPTWLFFSFFCKSYDEMSPKSMTDRSAIQPIWGASSSVTTRTRTSSIGDIQLRLYRRTKEKPIRRVCEYGTNIAHHVERKKLNICSLKKDEGEILATYGLLLSKNILKTNIDFDAISLCRKSKDKASRGLAEEVLICELNPMYVLLNTNTRNNI